MGHTENFYRSCDLNPPKRHRKVTLRKRSRSLACIELKKLLCILRIAIGRRSGSGAEFGFFRNASEPIRLSRYIFLRRGRALPVRRLTRLHELYHRAQLAAQHILDALITEFDPTDDEFLRQRLAIRTKFDE